MMQIHVTLPIAANGKYELQDPTVGPIESVKAACEHVMPVAGTVIEINETLADEQGKINGRAAEGTAPRAWCGGLSIDPPDRGRAFTVSAAWEILRGNGSPGATLGN